MAEDDSEFYTRKDGSRFLEHFLPLMLIRLGEISVESIPIMWSTGSTMTAWDLPTSVTSTSLQP